MSHWTDEHIRVINGKWVAFDEAALELGEYDSENEARDALVVHNAIELSEHGKRLKASWQAGALIAHAQKIALLHRSDEMISAKDVHDVLLDEAKRRLAEGGEPPFPPPEAQVVELQKEVSDRDALLSDKNKRLCAMRVDRTRIALHRDALAQAGRALTDRLPAYPSAAGYFAQKELVALRDELATPDVAYAPVPDTCLHAHLRRQIAFSTRAFGPNDRWRGVVDHIKKELTEIEASPYDVEEWIDVALLALDGAWRSLAATREMTPAEMARKVVETLDAKMTKNENRDWPDWRTADRTKAIEHDRSKDRGTA